MKPRFWIIISVIILVIMGLVYWRETRLTPHKKIIVKKRAAAPAAVKVKKPVILPAIEKKFKNPKVAVVMDDFGYNMKNLNGFFGIKRPITLSILPNQPYSTRISKDATANGYEVILHLPLESHRKDVKEEFDTIRSAMNPTEVTMRLEEEIGCVPGLSGVSNHMGSKSTEEKALMTLIFRHLKKNGLYFLDSLTSEKSVCREAAASVGIKYARRDVFLDNDNVPEKIEKQLLELRRIAFRRGKAIAICHDRPVTIRVLTKVMPEMAADGIEFVFLSEMVN